MSGFYDLPFFPSTGSSDGVNGKDGVSPTISVEAISGGHRLIIVDATGRKTVDVMNGTNGKDGQQGLKGEPGTPGSAGKDGINGKDGAAGKDGIDGKDGLGIKSLTINNLGELVITYTDNTEINLGKVVGATGPQGPQGEPGSDGQPGKDGIDGQPGKDGSNGQDGINGKSAYEYAKDGGYTGTETEFAEILANTVDKRSITLGLHTDGLLYLFVNGEPIGTGIIINTKPET